MNKAILAVTAAAALALGGAVGAAAKPAEVVEVEKVVEKTVEKTPDACRIAFENAEKVFASSAKVIGYGQEAVQAAARLDADGILAQKELVDDETAVIQKLSPKYTSSKKECLG